MKRKHETPPLCQIVGDGTDVYVVVDGVKVAKRGRPGTPQARTWVSLEPGWRVFDNLDNLENPDDDLTIVVEHDGVRVH